MILTAEREKQIVDAIRANPSKAVVLPDHAYTPAGRAVVLVDGLPIDLHRHLHNILIRPLGYHERMHLPKWAPKGNVNPHLFEVIAGPKSPRKACPSGHAYEGNEAPPNSRGYRCRTCLRDSRRTPGAVPNHMKTHCPANHEYTEENTYVSNDGKRRCLECKRSRNRAYMARLRKESA